MKEISSIEFEKEVLSGGLVVVDFYSTECPPCEALAPKFEALSELYSPYVKFVKIFRQENRDLAASLGVMSSPTVLFYKNGVKTGEMLSGGVKRSDMIKNIDALLTEDIVKQIKSKIKTSESHYDVTIIGGGPSGIAAGIYLAQSKLRTVIIDKALPGGQVSTTHQVSNYPGFVDPVNGYMLSHFMSEQAKAAGVEYRAAVDVNSVNLYSKTIVIDDVETIKSDVVIIATGASPRYLGVPGEREFKGKGISYCATCDAKYFQDKEVIVIGGGNTAIEESEFISKFASKITVVHQFDKLTANKEAQEKAFANPKLSFMLEYEPREFKREGDKMTVAVEDLRTSELSTISADGIFVFAGMQPNVDMLDESLERDSWGYIKTNENMLTNIKGIYAIGDVISKKYRQITTAVSDGTIAAISIAKELNK